MVVQWLVLSHQSKKVMGFHSNPDLSVRSLHVLLVPAQVPNISVVTRQVQFSVYLLNGKHTGTEKGLGFKKQTVSSQ